MLLTLGRRSRPPNGPDGRSRDRRSPATAAQRSRVGRWFAELTNRKLRRAGHRSVAALEADVKAWIDAWNTDPKPFVWTRTADEILESLAAYCSRISDSGH